MPQPARVPVSLVRVRTRDGVFLDGLIVEPRRRRNVALVWVHGLGSVFSSGQPLIRALSTRLSTAGIAYLKLNTRGHDSVARGGRRLVGAAFERFGELSDVVVIRDRGTGRSRGFGFVTFADAVAGKEALRELDGSELDGRNIKVTTAEAR